MSKNFFDAVIKRRSYYNISKESPISDEKIQEMIETALLHAPTAFNSQSGRIVLLLRDEHDKLWDIVMEALRAIVNPDEFKPTEDKVNSFKAGYGTVLYYEDDDVTKGLQEQFPTYADNFPKWAEQSNGILQFIVGVSLEQEGFGASLQHYNELIHDKVKEGWNIPDNWRLIAQMPFGKPTEEPGEKEFAPVEERLKVYK